MRINKQIRRCFCRAAILVAVMPASCRKPGQAFHSAPNSTAPSGVYGFSGAGTPLGAPEGVIGECVWIFDADDRLQVAKGDCDEKDPGNFRVALKPGHYVLHGPGGNHRFHVQPGRWVRIESVASLPIAP